MTRPKNAARSRQARTGTATEELLQYAINAAQAAGVAYVTKRATPVRITSVDAEGRVVGYLDRSPGVDYHGVLKGGRAVFFEVKRCSSGAFPLRAIEPEQWDEMARARELGACTALVVLWKPNTAKGRALIGGRSHAWCVVPWGALRLASAEGRSRLPAKALAEFALDADANPIIALKEAAR